MSTTRYIISDASKKVDVEPHVLRYWEEELELKIPRNEMGHRYYRMEDIQMLKSVKVLKEQGFQLKAIKMLLPDLHKIDGLDAQSILKLKDEMNEKAYELENQEGVIETQDGTKVTMPKDNVVPLVPKQKEDVQGPADGKNMAAKMNQFKKIMNDLIVDALKENNADLSAAVSTMVADNVIKEMDYLLRVREEQEEERYKKFDETVREYQKSRQETAAVIEEEEKKTKGVFKRKKKKQKYT